MVTRSVNPVNQFLIEAHTAGTLRSSKRKKKARRRPLTGKLSYIARMYSTMLTCVTYGAFRKSITSGISPVSSENVNKKPGSIGHVLHVPEHKADRPNQSERGPMKRHPISTTLTLTTLAQEVLLGFGREFRATLSSSLGRNLINFCPGEAKIKCISRLDIGLSGERQATKGEKSMQHEIFLQTSRERERKNCNTHSNRQKKAKGKE